MPGLARTPVHSVSVWPRQDTSTHMQLAGRNSAEHVQLDDGAGRQADITSEVQSRPLRNDGVVRLLVLATEDEVHLGISFDG